ncbi:uncharacterized protein LOC27207416, partial [Drosophila simulans]|uniref:uncharacterized protein LOC27207416 n=1 Tax=Drosophila simulans TaxID=7240 RepID=UPI00192CEB00
LICASISFRSSVASCQSINHLAPTPSTESHVHGYTDPQIQEAVSLTAARQVVFRAHCCILSYDRRRRSLQRHSTGQSLYLHSSVAKQNKSTGFICNGSPLGWSRSSCSWSWNFSWTGALADSCPSWRRLRSSQATDCLALIIESRHLELGVDHKAIHSQNGYAAFLNGFVGKPKLYLIEIRIEGYLPTSFGLYSMIN